MGDYSFAVKLTCELIGTAILVILGNGTVANVHLRGSKGYHAGWSLIAMGYGLGVMIPVMMFHGVSGAQINPAMTVALAALGHQSWSVVPGYVAAQMVGAMAGQVAIVATHKPYYDRTEDPEDILATFSTINAAHSWVNGFANEFLGTMILTSSALAILGSPEFAREPGSATIGVGFLVWGLVAGLGGPTGPALNPARDLGPRIVHTLLPLRNKGGSEWSYGWVPVAAPVAGGLVGVAGYTWLLG